MNNIKSFFRSVKRVAAIVAIIAVLCFCAVGCENAQSGTNGKDGADGKNGADGTVTSVVLSDGKVTLDGENTGYDNKTLSAPIIVTANDDEMGETSGGGRYALNSAVILSAEPNKGYVFVCWQNENGETASKNRQFLVRASETAQNYTAVFDIDKNEAAINVYVRADKSLPDSAIVEGGGNYRYGTEYTLRVTAEDESVFGSGAVFFCEVTAEQFKDETFAVSDSSSVCSRGKTAVFDVDGVNDKYYVAAFKERAEGDISIGIDDPGFIIIEVACNIETVSSSDFYGKCFISKINGKTYDETAELPSIWAGDEVVVTAEPAKVGMSADYPYSFIKRSDFVCWTDELTGEIVSEEAEYSFVAKRQVKLKAVFAPKTIVHVNVANIDPRIISENGLVDNPLTGYLFYDGGAFASFYAGEKILIDAFFPVGRVEADRKKKFSWQMSYDNENWQTLSFDKQAYMEIPENATDIYLKIEYV